MALQHTGSWCVEELEEGKSTKIIPAPTATCESKSLHAICVMRDACYLAIQMAIAIPAKFPTCDSTFSKFSSVSPSCESEGPYVIGIKMLHYYHLGETMNTASCMESG